MTAEEIDRLAKLAWTTWASSGSEPELFNARWDAGPERWKDNWRLVVLAIVGAYDAHLEGELTKLRGYLWRGEMVRDEVGLTEDRVELLKGAVRSLRASAYTSDWDVADEIKRVFGFDEVE